MDNSLKIGQYFLQLLENDTELTQMLGEGKIFPLIAKEGTLYPLVVYTRDNVQTTYTKAYPAIHWDNTVSISYRVYSDKYDEALDIANKIRNVLEGHSFTGQDIKINEIQLSGCYEAFADDAFVETITFSTMVE